MQDFERLIDSLKKYTEPYAIKLAWETGYQAGKKRARYEMLAVIVALYFFIALIGHLASA